MVTYYYVLFLFIHTRLKYKNKLLKCYAIHVEIKMY